ncbi:MAG: AAA family ATPase [Verrucomicrobia bacterium]|nr:AAA family ATPase [Verrucomicrobiota bacterium]
MITRLTLRNFKSVKFREYDFTSLDLFVGWNNSGKSTVLQAIAIWQFCVDEFRRSKRIGTKGIQVILPNFTALPVPAFSLLWRDKKDREYPEIEGKKQQKFILIEIEVSWRGKDGMEHTFAVALRYQSAQTIYAIPQSGWAKFRELEQPEIGLPLVAYVPPFSGLEPQEEWRDSAPLRKQVGKAQPGSVLRNLLLLVCPPPPQEFVPKAKRILPPDWCEIVEVIKRWFGVELLEPGYIEGKDTTITCEYRQRTDSGYETFDIISGGSGFHQTLTLLAFLYGYRPTTILLDEPDAHLHVNLQREILDYFKAKSQERGVQFLIATHAEEFMRGVGGQQVVSLLAGGPVRLQSTGPVIAAMATLSNVEIARLRESPTMVYVEGESDERILRAWAPKVGASDWLRQIVFRTMNGGTKADMKAEADHHFSALQTVLPQVRRLMIFDYDTDKTAFHPRSDNSVLFEWRRKNIENYLLVPPAWHRAIERDPAMQSVGEIFAQPLVTLIDAFFTDQNLILPPGKNWRELNANIFQVLDGKRLLFENDDSLFHQLRTQNPDLIALREKVAGAMEEAEIHADVLTLFAKLKLATAS